MATNPPENELPSDPQTEPVAINPADDPAMPQTAPDSPKVPEKLPSLSTETAEALTVDERLASMESSLNKQGEILEEIYKQFSALRERFWKGLC